MAKTVKVYNGSVSASTVIYTVPSGRNAAVTLAAISSTSGGTSVYTPGSYSVVIPNATVLAPCAAAVGANALAGGLTLGATTANAVFPAVSYLSTGQTLTIGGLSNTNTYSVSVVEEY